MPGWMPAAGSARLEKEENAALLSEAPPVAAPSLRAQRSNPSRGIKKEWIASLRSQ
jgi:hypothetical protein